MQQLAYPVLIYTEKFIHSQYKNPRQLCEKTIESYKRKIYDSMIIIDSSGFRFKVLSYKRKFDLRILISSIIGGLFEFFTRPLDEYGTWIEFELSEPEKITFEEAKAEILALFKKNPRWFKKSHENFNTIEEDLASYKSLQDMIENIGGYP